MRVSGLVHLSAVPHLLAVHRDSSRIVLYIASYLIGAQCWALLAAFMRCCCWFASVHFASFQVAYGMCFTACVVASWAANSANYVFAYWPMADWLVSAAPGRAAAHTADTVTARFPCALKRDANGVHWPWMLISVMCAWPVTLAAWVVNQQTDDPQGSHEDAKLKSCLSYRRCTELQRVTKPTTCSQLTPACTQTDVGSHSNTLVTQRC
jgi:hypothetical protein